MSQLQDGYKTALERVNGNPRTKVGERFSSQGKKVWLRLQSYFQDPEEVII